MPALSTATRPADYVSFDIDENIRRQEIIIVAGRYWRNDEGLTVKKVLKCWEFDRQDFNSQPLLFMAEVFRQMEPFLTRNLETPHEPIIGEGQLALAEHLTLVERVVAREYSGGMAEPGKAAGC